MKKKKIIAILSILTVFVVACFITVNAQIGKNNSVTKDTVGYTVKSVYDEKQDGWIYGFEIIYVTEDSSINYIFDGYNLKYRPNGTEYYVSYRDMETGEEKERIPSKYATLSTSAVYRDEIKLINNFFNEKKYQKTISIDDLSDLDIEKIDKDYLVDLFNKTIESKVKTTPGQYLEAPSLEWKTQKSTDKENPGEWQVMYITDYGYIQDIEIEFIKSDDTYLSELANTRTISTKDSKLLNQIEQLEKQILDNQAISLSKDDTTINSDLTNLLNSLNEDVLTK